jgi:hypothetical protein
VIALILAMSVLVISIGNDLASSGKKFSELSDKREPWELLEVVNFALEKSNDMMDRFLSFKQSDATKLYVIKDYKENFDQNGNSFVVSNLCKNIPDKDIKIKCHAWSDQDSFLDQTKRFVGNLDNILNGNTNSKISGALRDIREIDYKIDKMFQDDWMMLEDESNQLKIYPLQDLDNNFTKQNFNHFSFLQRLIFRLNEIKECLESNQYIDQDIRDHFKKIWNYIRFMPEFIRILEKTGTECQVVSGYLGTLKIEILKVYLEEIYRTNLNMGLNRYQFFKSDCPQRLKMILNSCFGNVRYQLIDNPAKQGLGVLGGIVAGAGSFFGGNKLPPVVFASDAAYEISMGEYSFIQKTYHKLGDLGKRAASLSLIVGIPILGVKIISAFADALLSSFGFFKQKIKNQMLTQVRQVSGDPIKFRAAIQEFLSKMTLGLEDIIVPLSMDLAGGALLNRASGISNKRKSQIMAFNGPPGVGKSYMGRLICLILTGGDIVSSLYLPASMLLDIKLIDYFREDSVPFKLVNNKRVVIFIDEFDKLPLKKRVEIQNFFRDAVDYGSVTVNPPKEVQSRWYIPQLGFAKLNMSGCIIIISSNASQKSWNKNAEFEDETGVRDIKIDESFASRVSLYHFHDFSHEIYCNFYKKWFVDFNIFLKSSNIVLIYDDSDIQNLAQFSVDAKKGARSVEEITAKIASLITTVTRIELNRFIKFFQYFLPKKKLFKIKISCASKTYEITAVAVEDASAASAASAAAP